MRRAAASVVIGACAAFAGEQPVVPLWPGEPPGAKVAETEETYSGGHVRHVHTPTITVYLPPQEKAAGTGVVICPGGGYWLLAIDHEGHEIARWLNSIGIAAFILKYRHGEYKHPIPLLDAGRAISLVRHRSSEWRVDPARIGILGFSAGGHLASTAGTHFHTGAPGAADPIDRVSNRPDFMVLAYPVISFTQEYTHRGSRQNLLGENPDPELVKSLSNELAVTPETPPTFLVHAHDDTGVPPENSVSFYLALSRAKVPAELHIYEKGGHGFGMRKDAGAAAVDWPRRCADWLRVRGLLGANGPQG